MRKEDLLRKIKALAQSGVGGERESANAILERLMEKYGIEESELSHEAVEMTWFKYDGDLERKLLNQVVYMVTGKGDMYIRKDSMGRKMRQNGAYCTKSQAVEIEYCYSFFKEAMKEELQDFYIAFLYKHRIFPSTTPENQDEDEPLDLDKLNKIAGMMRSMDDRELRRALPGETGGA